MGGDAFGRAVAHECPTLHTPRMKPAEYAALREVLLQRLRTHFPEDHVVCPRELPEKENHGDIDFVIAFDGAFEAHMELARSLGAYGVIVRPNAANLACPSDGSMHIGPAVVFRPSKTDPEAPRPELPDGMPNRFVQVDVSFVPKQRFRWHLFDHSYGGAGMILGPMIKPAGLRRNHKGLWLRLAALDEARADGTLRVSEESGMLHLSDDVDKIMEFLGLSSRSYHAGFHTQDAFFRWLSECELIAREVAFVMHIENRARPSRTYRSSTIVRLWNLWFSQHLAQQRDAQSDWYQRVAVSAELSSSHLRRTWQDCALDFFGKHAEFERLRAALVTEMEQQIAEQCLKPLVAAASGFPAGHMKHREIVRGLRRWVAVLAQQQIQVLPLPHADGASQLHRLLATDRRTLEDPVAVQTWLNGNWIRVRALERERRYGDVISADLSYRQATTPHGSACRSRSECEDVCSDVPAGLASALSARGCAGATESAGVPGSERARTPPR